MTHAGHASLWAAMGTTAANPDELMELDYHFCCATDRDRDAI
jgi:hypothetical protein